MMRKSLTIFVALMIIVLSACAPGLDNAQAGGTENTPPAITESVRPFISSEVLDANFHSYNEMTAANDGEVYFAGHDGIYVYDDTTDPVRIISVDDGFVIRALAVIDDYIYYLVGAKDEIRFLRADHEGGNITELTANVNMNDTWNFSSCNNKLIVLLTSGFVEADATVTSDAIVFTDLLGCPAPSGLSFYAERTSSPEGQLEQPIKPPIALFVELRDGGTYKVIPEIKYTYIVTNDHILYVLDGRIWLTEIDGSEAVDITSRITAETGTDRSGGIGFVNFDSDNVYFRYGEPRDNMIYVLNLNDLTLKSYFWGSEPFDVIDGYAYGFSFDETSGYVISMSLETGEQRKLLEYDLARQKERVEGSS